MSVSNQEQCRLCEKPIDWGELCEECAKDNDPFGADLEDAGGWMIQDGRNRD